MTALAHAGRTAAQTRMASGRQRGGRVSNPGHRPWPTRDQWLAIGYVPCRGQGCAVLVNPTEIKRCAGCRSKAARHNRGRGR